MIDPSSAGSSVMGSRSCMKSRVSGVIDKGLSRWPQHMYVCMYVCRRIVSIV